MPAASATADLAGLRALWLTERFPPSGGGMAESCDRIVRSLRELGVVVDVAHLTSRTTEWRTSEQAGGRLLACPLDDDPAHALGVLWARLAEAERYSHVVAFGGVLPLLAGPMYAAWLDVPHVALVRGNDFDVGMFSPPRRAMLAEAFERSACVCAVTREKADRIAALHPDTTVAWTPNGIDHGRWAPAPSDHRRAAAWRAEHVQQGRRVIGLFGQLKRKKGGMLLLDALMRSGRRDRLHVLLGGWLEPEMQTFLDARRDDIDFTIVPFMDRYELLPLFLACDLVALPSFYDGMPNVMAEAAALGVPLVASRTGGMADFLADREHAFTFSPGDLEGCALALRAAADAPAEGLARMGRACRALAQSELDHRREALRYTSVLRSTRWSSTTRSAAVSAT